jgi:hypothetical protein
MGKVIPEDVHAGCVEEAERLRRDLIASEAWRRDYQLSAGLLSIRVDELAAALDGYAMDLAHTEALYEELHREHADQFSEMVKAQSEARGLRACLDRIEERCAASGWERLVANKDSETYDGGYYDGMGTAVTIVREERAALAEGQPAGEPTQDAEPAQCRCREHWIGAQGEACSRGAFPLASYLCLHCGRCRACHAQPAEGGK